MCEARRANTRSSSPRWPARASCGRASTASWSSCSGEPPTLDKQKKHSIDIVVDRIVVKPGIEKRLADSIETALKVSGGLVVLAPQIEGQPSSEETLSQSYSCVECGTSLTEITPRLFSFNSPYGACPTCSGLGTLMGVDPDKVVPDPERSILAGAVAPWPEGSKSWRLRMVETLSKAMGFSLSTPWKRLPPEARRVILEGSGEKEIQFSLAGKQLELLLDRQLRGRGPDARTAPQGDRVAGASAPRSRSTCRSIPARPAAAGGCGPKPWP